MAYKNPEDRRAYHREYMRERREWLRAHHMCTECGRQDARTLRGHGRCFDCLERHRGHPLEIIIEKKQAEPKQTRKERTDAGRCYLCGAPVKTGSPTWDTKGRPFRVCEKHYQQLCKMGKKGREGRLRPLWPAANTEKARAALDACKARRLKLKQELETTGRYTPTPAR